MTLRFPISIVSFFGFVELAMFSLFHSLDRIAVSTKHLVLPAGSILEDKGVVHLKIGELLSLLRTPTIYVVNL